MKDSRIFTMKSHIKAGDAALKTLKDACKIQVRREGGSHSFLWYDVLRLKKRQRHFFLLYGYVRGIPYKEIERNPKSEPDWEFFRQMAFDWPVVCPPYFRGCDIASLRKDDLIEHDVSPYMFRWVLDNCDHEIVEADLTVSGIQPYLIKLCALLQLFPKDLCNSKVQSYFDLISWVYDAKSYFLDVNS